MTGKPQENAYSYYTNNIQQAFPLKRPRNQTPRPNGEAAHANFFCTSGHFTGSKAAMTGLSDSVYGKTKSISRHSYHPI